MINRAFPILLVVMALAIWSFYPKLKQYWQSQTKQPSFAESVSSMGKLPAYRPIGLPEDASIRLGSSNYQHEDIIFLQKIRYSPDGRLMICTDGSFYFIWSLESGKMVRRFNGGTAYSPFDISRDGRFLACISSVVAPGSVTNPNTVCIINLHNWERRFCEDSPDLYNPKIKFPEWYRDLRFTPDGLHLLGSKKNAILIWNASSGSLLKRITDNTIDSGIFTPDVGSLIWSGEAQEGKPIPIHVWSLEKHNEVALLPGHASGFIEAQTVSPDGKLLVTAGFSGGIRLWDLESNTMLHELEQTECKGLFSNTALAFSPDGKQLVTAKVRRPWRLWDCITGKELATWPNNCYPSSAAFSPDGSTIAYISDGRRVCFRDVLVGQDQPTPISHTGGIADCIVTADGSSVVSAGADGKIIVWSLESGLPLRVLRQEGASVYALSRGIDDVSILASGEGFMEWLDLASGSVLRSFPMGGISCLDLDVSSDTGRVAVVAIRAGLRTPRVFDVYGGNELHIPYTILCADHARFLPGADRIVVNFGPVPSIVDFRAGQVNITHSIGGERIEALRCSGNGQYIAAADYKGKLIVWDRVSNRETMQLHSCETHGLAFSPAGSMLAVGLRDNACVPSTIGLFNPATGIQVATFSPDVVHIRCLAFSPDGNRLVSGFGDGSLLVWDVRKYY
ncbi:MAG: hypothetical protein WA705_21680 [Candidatus Ozemobacteraceae bacterium]